MVGIPVMLVHPRRLAHVVVGGVGVCVVQYTDSQFHVASVLQNPKSLMHASAGLMHLQV